MDRLTELAVARASGDITASMLLPPQLRGHPAFTEFEEVLLLLLLGIARLAGPSHAWHAALTLHVMAAGDDT
jgi:hypothetical protein